jgi:hypothetical protein
MNKEEMLLDALNRFGNFTSVTQEFSEEQLGVIYELMDMVEQRNKVSGDDTRTEPALPIHNVSKSVPTKKYEINFGGNVLAGLEISNNEPTVIGAMNGWGNGISKDDITITEK